MAFRKLSKFIASRPRVGKQDQKGIALFMVIAAVSMLTIMVTEFTYVAQVNARMIFDSADQVKAHFLAKTGLKISLLRLKAYQKVKTFTAGNPAMGAMGDMVNQIWSFPFLYPIPTTIPGLPVGLKDEIAKFQKESSLEGSFTAVIEAESSKININTFLTSFQAKKKKDRSVDTSSTRTESDSGRGSGSDSKKAEEGQFDAVEAKKALKEILVNIVQAKFKEDPDFANEYNDLNMDEMVDNILGWIDYTHQPANSSGRQLIPYKHAPFYHISELRMIYPFDDKLYDLIAPNFTTALTPGININKIKTEMMTALFPSMSEQELKDFFKYRDDADDPHPFGSAADFWKWMTGNASQFHNDSNATKKYEDKLKSQGIRFITDEETFRILVNSEVNKSTRRLEAWVQMSSNSSKKKASTSSETESATSDNAAADTTENTESKSSQDTGLRIIFMREL